MTNRDWFCVALRVLGVWQLLQTVQQIAWSPALLGAGVYGGYGLVILIGATTTTALGVGLLLFAPAIAERFYPLASGQPTGDMEGQGSALRIGMQVLGVVALLRAIPAFGGVLTGLFYRGGFMGGLRTIRDGDISSQLLSFGFHLVFAVVLLAGPNQIIAWLSRLRYVAERDTYEPPPIEEQP